jgi:hypothetical protein
MKNFFKTPFLAFGLTLGLMLSSLLHLQAFNFNNLDTCARPVEVWASSNSSGRGAWVSFAQAPATNYQIRYARIASGAWQTRSFLATDSLAYLGDLWACDSYKLQIRKICTVNDTSLWSSERVFRTLCPPLDSTASCISDSIQLSRFDSAGVKYLTWRASVSNSHDFEVHWRDTRNPTWNVLSVRGFISGEPFVLSSCSNHEVKVRSRCGNGNVSRFSNVVNIDPCCQTGFSLRNLSSTAFSITLPTTSSTYKIDYKLWRDTTWLPVPNGVTQLSGLVSYGDYQVRLQLWCNNQWVVKDIQTIDLRNFCPSPSIAFIGATDTSATFQFTNSANVQGVSYYLGNQQGFLRLNPGATTQNTLFGLRACTNNSVSFNAVCDTINPGHDSSDSQRFSFSTTCNNPLCGLATFEYYY